MSQSVELTASRRERQRQATLAEIVAAARALLTDPAGLSLRAVAQRMGMTPPALYRYVDNYQDLVLLVAQDIDRTTAALLRDARDSQPADDPVARIVCTSLAFRRWALDHREEFGVVFANLNAPTPTSPEDLRDQQVGLVFTDLLLEVWQKHRFPVPALDELDPAVVESLGDPVVPARVEAIPPEATGLLWVFTQSWVLLYGTVTLEVFGHCDPRLMRSGALFRAMIEQQAERLHIEGELPRLRPLVDAWLLGPAAPPG